MGPGEEIQAAKPLGVIVPAYNEGRTIGQVLQRVLFQACVREVVVVDDCSTDETAAAVAAFANDPRVSLRRHPTNRGKGAAVRTGLEAIEAPIVVIQDADLEYDPVDYMKLIGPIVGGRADVVYGVRGFAGQTAYSYWFVKGNQLVTTATNVLFNCYIQDMETGFKADDAYHGERQSALAAAPRLPPLPPIPEEHPVDVLSGSSRAGRRGVPPTF